MDKKLLQRELSNDNKLGMWFYPIFRFIVKFIAPLAIAGIFLNGLGLLNV
jgi:NSS family neurotransmitter:Na+ symporter